MNQIAPIEIIYYSIANTAYLKKYANLFLKNNYYNGGVSL